jgi:hypothetical protein
MSTRPTSRESECRVKKLEMERESFQEAISAVSYHFYPIDANYYKILKANADAKELHSGKFNQPICYSWRHKRSTPCKGEEQPSPFKITEKQNHRIRWNLPNMITGDDPNF